MQLDYKALIVNHNTLYQNLCQRVDLAQRSLDTIDYKIQLELYYQNGQKSVKDKYGDHKLDEAFQFIASDASNKVHIQEQLIIDYANARAHFSEEILAIHNELKALNIQKEKYCKLQNRSIQLLKFSHNKYGQCQSFAISTQKVYERNLTSLDIINENIDSRLGHIAVIRGLDAKHTEFQQNYVTATLAYNKQLELCCQEIQEHIETLKQLDIKLSDSIRNLFQKIVLAQISAIRNNQYDLEAISKFLEKVDYTKIKQNFKYTDEIFEYAKHEQYFTYISRPANKIALQYKITDVHLSDIHCDKLTNSQEDALYQIANQIQNQQDEQEILNALNLIEHSIKPTNVIPIVELLSSKIKAPQKLTRHIYASISHFFIKLLKNCPKEGLTVQKIQKLSNLLYTVKDVNVTIYEAISQQDIFQKTIEYWEWLLFWQINQVIEGVSQSDRQVVIQQYFQMLLQQMAQLTLSVNSIGIFMQDMAPYYNISQTTVDQIKKSLQQFVHAQNCGPKSKGKIESFDAVE